MFTVTSEFVSRVLTGIDQGQMSVDAATCYAMGEQNCDRSSCVALTLLMLSFGLNDAQWSSNAARAKGMRRLAIAQLGTADSLDEHVLAEKLHRALITKMLPKMLRSAAALQPEPHKSMLLEAANRCETEGTTSAAADSANAADAAGAVYATYAASYAAVPMTGTDAAYAAYVARYAADAAAEAAEDAADATADQQLSEFAEEVAQILVEMNTPGSNFLFLTQ